MPPILDINADVFDITKYTPKNGESFLIDTNVLIYLTYPNTAPGNAKINQYTSFISKAINNNARIYYSAFSIPEMSHVIESNEWDLYAKLNGLNKKQFTLKEFRHNHLNEHNNVVNLIKTSWNLASRFGTLLDAKIDAESISRSTNIMQNSKLDGYDLFIIDSMIENGITKIVTNDGDFSTVPGIELFTANLNAINTARKANKLVA